MMNSWGFQPLVTLFDGSYVQVLTVVAGRSKGVVFDFGRLPRLATRSVRKMTKVMSGTVQRRGSRVRGEKREEKRGGGRQTFDKARSRSVDQVAKEEANKGGSGWQRRPPKTST